MKIRVHQWTGLVLTEGREWTRQRLQQRLPAQAQAASALFPLRQRQTRTLTLHTVVGDVVLSVDYGRDPQTGKWGCPAQACWGLGPHQKMTPELEDRACLTATLADSYQAAATLAAKWGSPVDASPLRQHACAVGQRAERQAQARGHAPAPTVRPPAGAKAKESAALVIMMDDWLARQRGEAWGLEPADAAGGVA